MRFRNKASHSLSDPSICVTFALNNISFAVHKLPMQSVFCRYQQVWHWALTWIGIDGVDIFQQPTNFSISYLITSLKTCRGECLFLCNYFSPFQVQQEWIAAATRFFLCGPRPPLVVGGGHANRIFNYLVRLSSWFH